MIRAFFILLAIIGGMCKDDFFKGPLDDIKGMIRQNEIDLKFLASDRFKSKLTSRMKKLEATMEPHFYKIVKKYDLLENKTMEYYEKGRIIAEKKNMTLQNCQDLRTNFTNFYQFGHTSAAISNCLWINTIPRPLLVLRTKNAIPKILSALSNKIDEVKRKVAGCQEDKSDDTNYGQCLIGVQDDITYLYYFEVAPLVRQAENFLRFLDNSITSVDKCANVGNNPLLSSIWRKAETMSQELKKCVSDALKVY